MIGRYSIYLWHWPLMVFAVSLWPEAPFARALAAALSFLPAVASYRWVERPIRQLPPLTPGRTFALVGAIVSPAILLAATVDFAAGHYWIPRNNSGSFLAHQGDTSWADFFSLLSRTYYPCTDRTIPYKGDTMRCWQSKPASRIDVAIVGDSHAEHLFVGLTEALPDKNIVYHIEKGFPSDPYMAWTESSTTLHQIRRSKQ